MKVQSQTNCGFAFLKRSVFFLHVFFVSGFSIAQTNYSALYNSSNFIKTIDLSRAVGTVSGEMGTTPAGGVTYSIPIYAPPGTNGLQPSISITYNSQGGPGVVGYGWNISGLSIIGRSGKNLYQDEEVSPVQYYWEDAFLLDGVRLNPVQGDNGANGTIYATESETFSKIRSWTGGGSWANPDWFEVTTKDGTVIQFGNTTDSRIMAENGYSVMMWRLNRIIDINGNYVDFKYNNTLRDTRIDEIIYTGNVNTGLVPYNKIKFTYGNRYETNKVYEAGASLTSSYLLNKITITHTTEQPATETVKTYQFNYGFDNVHSLLKEIVEYGEGLVSPPALNSTIFLYGDQPQNIQIEAQTSLAGSTNYFPGDFDADGKVDLLQVKSYFDSQMNMRFDSAYSLIKDFQGSGLTLMYSKSLPQGTKLNLDDKKFFNFLTSDYNKDGRDDVLQTNIAWSATHLRRYLTGITINLTGNHNSGTGYYDYAIQNCPVPTVNDVYIHPSGNFFIPGDFDGDGNQDYILILAKWISGNQFEYNAFVSFPAKGSYNLKIKDLGYGIQAPPGNYAERVAEAHLINAIDIDGDGKTEIMVTHGAKTYFFSLKKTSDYPPYLYIALNHFDLITEEINYESKVYPGDFNGDRKTDLLVRNANNTWKIITSTGTSLLVNPFTFNQTVVMNGSVNHKILISDFNGDGKSDILHGINDGFASSSTFSVYYSKGFNSWLNESYPYNNPIPSVQPVIGQAFTYADFNGDGRSDILNILSVSGGGDIVYFKPDGKERLLLKVTDGHNTTTSFEYKRLTDKSSYPYVYNRTVPLDDPANQSPYNYVQLPMYVVSAVSAPNGIGGVNTTNFFYEDAVIHRYAKGFLGFKKTTIINNTTGLTSVAEMGINTQFATPYLLKQTTRLTSNNELISENTVTTSFIDLSTGPHDKRFFQRPDKTLTKDVLNGQAEESENTYDNYGNITTNVTKKGYMSGSSVIATETTTTVTTYGTFGTPFPARPTSRQVTNLRSGMSALSLAITFQYSTIGRLTQKIAFSGLPKAVTTVYTYNSLGNILSEQVSATGVTTNTTNYSYDSRGRFPLSKELQGGSLTIKESSVYDGKWGKPLSQTSSDCIATTYQYDAFGRLKKTNFPEGFHVNSSLHWDISGNNIFYALTDYSAGKPDGKTWYDKLGRETRTDIVGFGSQWLSSSVTYNTKGQVTQKTAPAYSLETPLNTAYTYDVYGRVLTETNQLNTVSYSYAALANGKTEVTVTKGGQSASKITDAAGRAISSIDNGGQLDFTYNSRGNQVQVKHGTQTVVQSVYDDYGNQVQLTDVNAGTIQYTYDAFGRLHTQTDALSNTYTMAYDAIGRLLSRTGPEGVTSYEYAANSELNPNPACGSANNRIVTVTGFNGVNKSYRYDNLGRVIRETVTIDGIDYQTSFAYNTYSDLTKTTYPSGVEVNNIYDANGYLTSVTGGTSGLQNTLFTGTAQNGFGQFTQYTSGNGKASQNAYHFGIPLRFYTQGVQDLRMTWDYTKGNLLSRQDVLKGFTEDFTFDNLNRLTSASINGTQQFAISYDGSTGSSMGNITAKTDAGNYVYKNDKIHAVAYITNPAGAQAPPVTISTDQQAISYTPFLKAAIIDEGNIWNLSFTYGPDYERVKTVFKESGMVTETRYFLGSYEKQVTGGMQPATREIHYVAGGNGLCAVLVKEGGTITRHFVYTDHLGSLLTVTNTSGAVTASQNFDAWGRNRNPNNWLAYLPPLGGTGGGAPAWLYRGYTGHEHLPHFALINMNGRIYDPIQGRMISPDNYVPDPWGTQGYNRYAYANNNPLSYTDPDGNFIWFVLGGAILGGYLGASMQQGTLNPLKWNSDWWKGAITGAIVGAGVGALAASMMPATAGGIFANSATAAGGITKAWGITTSILTSANINIAMNGISGGGWDGAWKAGMVGAASGAWVATGGLGLAKNGLFGSKLAGKLAYQIGGTAMGSIGSNWIKGNGVLSKVNVGVGPITFTLGKGQKLFQFGPNAGSIITNGLGLMNAAFFDGKIKWDNENLGINYIGGLYDKIDFGSTGAYAAGLHSGQLRQEGLKLIAHEYTHTWDSRVLSNLFLPNYYSSFLFSIFHKGKNAFGYPNLYYNNYYEFKAFTNSY